MKRRIDRHTAFICSFLALAGTGFWNNDGKAWGQSYRGDQGLQSSPSDVILADEPTRVSSRPSSRDEPWMRGLDSVTGTEDVVGSGNLDPGSNRARNLGAGNMPLPIAERYFAAPVEEAPYVHPPHCPCCINETPITRFRQSFYQGTSLTGGYLSDGGDDALSIAHYEATVRFGIPLDGMDNVLIIAPSFRQEMVNGPANIDIADNLFVTGVNFTWMKKYSDRLRTLAMVSPSIRSDFEATDDAVRVFGLGLLTYSLIPKKLDASVGVVYLDRDDIPILPALGITWTPKPWWQFDLNFPRPRIAYRTDKDGGFSENWVYTGVALGGNTWAVERANGTNDVLTLRDYQWVFGWEHLREGGRGLFAETGFAFGRSLEYERGGEEVDFDNALFVRLGINL